MAVEREYDIIVVGSGAAGLTTAVVAASRGLKVLLAEKAEYLGGTTAYSGGAAWIPCNPEMPGHGIEDNPGDADAYLRQVLGNVYDAGRIGAYLESGPRMVEYLHANTDVRFKLMNVPDYWPETQGARWGRSLSPAEFDGTRLGAWLARIRHPLPSYRVLKSMQVDYMDGDRMRNVLRNPRDFLFGARRFAKYWWDLLRWGQGTRMANGNALVGRLLHSALQHGVEVRTSAPVTELEVEHGAVVGARVGGERVRARLGVVLASGGFGANREMIEAHMPLGADYLSAQPSANTGDGINMGVAAGGVFGEENLANGIQSPVSVVRDSKGRPLFNHPHFAADRAKPGAIVVDGGGRRFTNDAAPYQPFVIEMFKKEVGRAHVIADRTCVRRWGLGAAPSAPLPIGSFIRSGYLKEASSIRELAAKIGVDADELERTVRSFNANAAKGVDPEFGRGESLADRIMGDPANTPNPSLRPLEHGPFYAVEIHAGDCCTILGMKTTAESEVLRPDGRRVDGLFAVGLDQNSVMRGAYPGGGSSIGPAMTFAFRLAMRLADEAQASTGPLRRDEAA